MLEFAGGYPARFIEQNLLINGFVGIAETDKIRAYFGGMGGVLDEYYLPSIFIVANPWLKLNKEFNIYRDYHEKEFSKKDDCIIGLNDTFSYGLYPLIEKYAIQLATNEITLNVADINSRAINILTATSDSAYNSYSLAVSSCPFLRKASAFFKKSSFVSKCFWITLNFETSNINAYSEL